MSQPDIHDDYAALLRRVHSGGHRFIPVRVAKIDLPPYPGPGRPTKSIVFTRMSFYLRIGVGG